MGSYYGSLKSEYKTGFPGKLFLGRPPLLRFFFPTDHRLPITDHRLPLTGHRPCPFPLHNIIRLQQFDIINQLIHIRQ
jgi:hypothetical protein